MAVVSRKPGDFLKEKEADEAEDDAVKAKNTSDILKARQANMRYEVDDLSNSLLGTKTIV